MNPLKFDTAAAERGPVIPGTTASGLASATQLIDVTPFIPIIFGQSAVAQPVTLVEAPIKMPQSTKPLGRLYLTAEEDPILARLWDNDDDAAYDSM